MNKFYMIYGLLSLAFTLDAAHYYDQRIAQIEQGAREPYVREREAIEGKLQFFTDARVLSHSKTRERCDIAPLGMAHKTDGKEAKKVEPLLVSSASFTALSLDQDRLLQLSDRYSLLSLQKLDLSGRRLGLPRHMFKVIRNLEVLHLKKCGIEFMPDISMLKNLKDLDISYNNMRTLCVNGLESLEHIDISGNPYLQVECNQMLPALKKIVAKKIYGGKYANAYEMLVDYSYDDREYEGDVESDGDDVTSEDEGDSDDESHSCDKQDTPIYCHPCSEYYHPSLPLEFKVCDDVPVGPDGQIKPYRFVNKMDKKVSWATIDEEEGSSDEESYSLTSWQSGLLKRLGMLRADNE